MRTTATLHPPVARPRATRRRQDAGIASCMGRGGCATLSKNNRISFSKSVAVVQYWPGPRGVMAGAGRVGGIPSSAPAGQQGTHPEGASHS